MKLSDVVPIWGARLALGLLAAIVIGAFAILNHLQDLDIRELEMTGVDVQASLSYKDCRNHGIVGYRFVVLGERYGGEGSGCVSSCDDAKIGDSVTAVYAEGNPSNSQCALISTRRHNINMNYNILFVVSLVVATLIYRGTRQQL